MHQYKIFAFLALLAVGLFGPMPNAHADLWGGGKTLYDCPDIQRKSIETGYGEMFQGYDGWFFKHNDFDENFVLNTQTENYLKRLNAALQKQGINLVIVSPLLPKPLMATNFLTPDQVELHDYDKERLLQDYQTFIGQVHEAGIAYPEIGEALGKFNAGKVDQLIFKKDLHWTPEGAHFIAGQLAKTLKELPVYDGLDKITVSSQKTGSGEYVSNMHEHLRTICTSGIPPEKINTYSFARQDEQEESTEALFGDTAPPPVTLVGSSFSYVEDFGFQNFIEQEAALEVANYAIAGGMLFTAIISYLNSDDFIKEKPPILLWEVASRYDLNLDAPTYFRQLIPAVSGECTGDKIVQQTTTQINKDTETLTLLSALKDQKISGKEYYLYIKADNPVFNRFRLDFEYEDGDGEFFTIDHSGRYKNSGRFFVELSEDIDTNLSGIALENRDDTDVNLTAKLCKK